MSELGEMRLVDDPQGIERCVKAGNPGEWELIADNWDAVPARLVHERRQQTREAALRIGGEEGAFMLALLAYHEQ